jgi:hypothetical protein
MNADKIKTAKLRWLNMDFMSLSTNAQRITNGLQAQRIAYSLPTATVASPQKHSLSLCVCLHPKTLPT